MQGGRGQQDVCGLGHVGSMQAVVVGHVSMVVVLQGQQESHQRVRRDPEGAHQVSLLGMKTAVNQGQGGGQRERGGRAGKMFNDRLLKTVTTTQLTVYTAYWNVLQ